MAAARQRSSFARRAPRDRRRELEARLAAEGFAGALATLGPAFALYGRYLSARPDLFAPAELLELAALPDRAPPLPPAELRSALARELGSPVQAVFRELDEEPAESRLLFQVHRARLVSGQDVTLRLRRPGLRELLETDLELLPALGLPVAAEEGVPVPVDDVVADFARSVHRVSDLEREAEALDGLAEDLRAAPTWAAGLLRVPAVHRRLSTPALLVHEAVDGIAPEELATDPDADPLAHRRAAARLSLLWLALALDPSLQGGGFPAEPRDGFLRLLPDGRIALLGGGLVRLREAARGHLRDYLLAAAAGEPAEALGHLLPETTRDGHTLPEEHLRLRVRQVVPFRDGTWSDGEGELAEHLFLQWRVARECGYRPRAHLVAFYRGLASAAQLCRSLTRDPASDRAPGHDALRAGVEELRRLEGVEELRGLVSPLGAAGWGRGLEPHARLLLELPQKLDEVLSLLSRGEALVRLQVSDPPEAERRRSSVAALAALGLAVVAVAVLVPRLAGPDLAGVWAERAGAVLLLGLGALMLRAIRRMG